MHHSSTTTIPHQELVALYRKALLSGLDLDKVEKKVSSLYSRADVTQKVEKVEVAERGKQIKRGLPRAVRAVALLLPLLLIGVGTYLVGSATWPVLQYYVTTLPGLRVATLQAPVPREQVLDIAPLVYADSYASASATKTDPVIIDSALDYTNLAVWFSDKTTSQLQQKSDEVYYIDIPTLNIQNAEVAIGGTDLSGSLIQYPGTALPGEFGSPVVFGHSILRQFYNPSEKNPKRYMSIFSTIMTMKKGEPIYIRHNNVKYTYIVQDKVQVKPEDTYILSQKYDAKTLKLVTCTPEGTYLMRGVIRAQLVSN